MSPKKFSHPIPRLAGRQSWCKTLDSVLYSIGSTKDGMAANLNKNSIFEFFNRNVQLSWQVKFHFSSFQLIWRKLKIRLRVLY